MLTNNGSKWFIKPIFSPQENPSLTPQECFTTTERKFSALHRTDVELWAEVQKHWDKLRATRSLYKPMQTAKRVALGLSGSLLAHMKEVEDAQGSNIVRNMIGRVVIKT